MLARSTRLLWGEYLHLSMTKVCLCHLLSFQNTPQCLHSSLHICLMDGNHQGGQSYPLTLHLMCTSSLSPLCLPSGLPSFA